MALHANGDGGRELTEQLSVRRMFTRSGEATSVPKTPAPAGAMDTGHRLPDRRTTRSMFDGNARLNLATLVTTRWSPRPSTADGGGPSTRT